MIAAFWKLNSILNVMFFAKSVEENKVKIRAYFQIWKYLENILIKIYCQFPLSVSATTSSLKISETLPNFDVSPSVSAADHFSCGIYKSDDSDVTAMIAIVCVGSAP